MDVVCKFYWVVCQEMDGVSLVLFYAVSGKGLKGVSTFQMSLWAVYKLGGPALKNYEAANLEFL